MKRLLIIFIPIMLLAQGCVEDVDFSTGFDSKVVVNCILQNTDRQTLRLTYNSRLDGNYDYASIHEADIVLKAEEMEVGRFSYDTDKDEWFMNFRPTAGIRYKLEISGIEGSELIWAETTMPDIPPVSALLYNDIQFISEISGIYPSDRQIVACQIKPSGPYWIYFAGSVIYQYSERTFVEGPDIVRHIGTSHPYADNFNAMDVNIANTKLRQGYVRIEDTSEINEDFVFFVLESEETANLAGIVFMSLSSEYDKYMKESLTRMMLKSDVDNPAAQLQETFVFSNINGGIGIFGAVNKYLVNLTREL